VFEPSRLCRHPDKFYKRKSQEKHFACDRIFSDFPARVNEQGWFCSSAPWTRFCAQPVTAVWSFSPSGFHRVVATKPVRSETNKQNGCQVPTMVLSEARGLSLFRVVREGLGSSKRLGARGTQRLRMTKFLRAPSKFGLCFPVPSSTRLIVEIVHILTRTKP
jgi:hypothetical protein